MTALEMTKKEYKSATIALIRAKEKNPASEETRNLKAKVKNKLYIIKLLERMGDNEHD